MKIDYNLTSEEYNLLIRIMSGEFSKKNSKPFTKEFGAKMESNKDTLRSLEDADFIKVVGRNYGHAYKHCHVQLKDLGRFVGSRIKEFKMAYSFPYLYRCSKY